MAHSVLNWIISCLFVQLWHETLVTQTICPILCSMCLFYHYNMHCMWIQWIKCIMCTMWDEEVITYHSQSPLDPQPASESTWGRAGGWRGQQSVGRSHPWTQWMPGTSRSPRTRSAQWDADGKEERHVMSHKQRGWLDALMSQLTTDRMFKCKY